MSQNFRTQPFKSPLMRISYAQGLIRPREQTRDSGETYQKYDCTLILDTEADPEGLQTLQQAVAECVNGQWGDKGIERFRKNLIRNPILDGTGREAHDREGNLRSGLGEGKVFIRPSSGKQPMIFNQRVEPADESELQSGYWGYAVLNAFAWHNPKNGDGVSFGINMFQIVKADEILGGGGAVDPTAFFEAVKTDQKSDVASAGDMFD